MSTFFIELNGSRPARKKSTDTLFGERFYKTINFLQRHCYEPIGIADLARASKMSRRGLHKAFGKHFGQSPGRELRRMRIERAKHLLANSNLHQKVIARICGYRSLNSFWVSFRAVVGQAPGEFRIHFKKSSRK